ncbi:hypothetical protein Tco_1228388 [Tanacetum coccineum]
MWHEKMLCRTTPGPGYEVGESSAAGTARRVGPTTARADLYGFADTLEAAPGRPMSRELGYGIRDTWVILRDEIIYSSLEGCTYEELYLEPESTRWRVIVPSTDTHYEGIFYFGLRLDPISPRILITGSRPEETDSDFRAAKNRLSEAEAVSRDPEDSEGLKAQMIEIQRQQGPAKRSAAPELPEEGRKWHQEEGPPEPQGQGQSPQLPHQSLQTQHLKCCNPEWRTIAILGKLVQEGMNALCGMTNDVAYAMTWSDLKKMMTTKYCQEMKSRRIEQELWKPKSNKWHRCGSYKSTIPELALLSDRMFPEKLTK